MPLSNRPLTPAQVRYYEEFGYVAVEGLLAEEEVAAFLRHEAERPKDTPYNLHGHCLDERYRYLAAHPAVAGGAQQLLQGPPAVVQTMLLDKSPAGGQGIALHQDCHYLPNEPNTLMACWLALTETDRGNGGLCVVPGSHRLGLQAAHKAKDPGEHAVWENRHAMRDRQGREWQETLVSFEIDVDPERIRYLTVPRGGGVFFTGMTIHGSYANRSENRPRIAFAVHYVHRGTWVLREDVQDTMPVLSL
ncbi:MAG: phytanoyl-CoA dioxygenase family protein [Armatimonadetes bacterium]|nr:phytanoyl-CoA dioxygenase family protein [Armatimonadota bacterium]